jgi:cell division protein FtsQ
MPEDGVTPAVAPEPSAEEPTVVVIGTPAPLPAPDAVDAPTPRAPHVAPPDRRRALMPWAIALGVLVLLGAVGLVLTYTPLFHAKTITVRGEQRLSEQRVLKLAGIGPGTDVFHLDVGAVERRLERDPWVADAVVTKRLPSTLSVTVTERRPAALTRSSEGRLLYVADDGTVLGHAPDMVLLPELLTTDPSAVTAAAGVAGSLPRSLAPVIATIGVGADGSVTLIARSGVTATYGDATLAQAKGEALKAVMDYAANQGKTLVSVDVQVPGSPTAVFAGAAVATPDPRS